MAAWGDSQLWDDEYRNAIAKLSGTEIRTKSDAVEIVRGSMWGWRRSSDYARIRRTIGELEESVLSSVRLEIGSQANGEYRFVWLVQQRGTTTLYSNLGGDTATTVVAGEDWQRCLETLRGSTAWELGAAGDFAVFDGATYFVSVFLPEGHGQFVVYAPALDDRDLGSERQKFAKETIHQTTVITAILELVRPRSGDPVE